MLPTLEEIQIIAKERYHQRFGNYPKISCCAPGRVNLIGEHVDYNDGYVLPMALPMVTVIMGGANRTSSTVNLVTCCDNVDQPHNLTFEITDLAPGLPKWANYIKGVIQYYLENNAEHFVLGFNAIIISNVPVGGGLSSSAALEVATLIFLEQLTGKCVKSDVAKALICQKAEHKFAGMPCGIMDQLISVAGKKSNVLLIDCKSLEFNQIPFESEDLTILICNSNVRHELSASEYPTRRAQCTEALKLMQLQSYRDATEQHLIALDNVDVPETLMKRARHVITEIKRTREATEALRMHDFQKLGELMIKSHISLRDDFQVSCAELDVLVDAAIQCAGVLGSRMTGGGFGGCTVTLLATNSIPNVIQTLQTEFNMKFSNSKLSTNFNGQKLEFYICKPSDGARVLVN